MFSELVETAMQSSPAAFIGVGLMVVYFVAMLLTIAYRIKKGDHVHH